METQLSKEEDLNYLLNKYNIDFNKYIFSEIGFYNRDNLVENNYNLYDITCPICLNILKNPINCSSNKNSHCFCTDCIDKYLINNSSCPICKNIFEYVDNEEIENILKSLSFKCVFKKEGCEDIISYSDYFDQVSLLLLYL